MGELDSVLGDTRLYGDAAPLGPEPRWRRPSSLIVAGLAVAGVTAAGLSIASAFADDTRDIRCYYHADLTRTYPAPYAPHVTLPPYILAGEMDAGSNTTNPLSLPYDVGPGHFVPELTACVVDDAVAVIPGPAQVCNQLGIPAFNT